MNNEINVRTLCTGVKTSEPITKERCHDICQTRRVVLAVFMLETLKLSITYKNGKPDGYIQRLTTLTISFKCVSKTHLTDDFNVPDQRFTGFQLKRIK